MVQSILADHRGSSEERISGLFSDALKWLLKKFGVKAIDWVRDRAHEFIENKTKGLPPQLMYSARDITEEDDSVSSFSESS